MAADIQSFFHEATNTFSYLVRDPAGDAAAVIDPVLDYDPAAGRFDTASADAVLDAVRTRGLDLQWILETHAHADHLSAAVHIREATGARLGIGRGIRQVQETFKGVFNLGPDFATDGSQFDHLFEDGERFRLGGLEVEVLPTPGHTSDSITYLIHHPEGDVAFVGDSLFMPDAGTARCDFPGGSAEILWASIQRLFQLPDTTRLFMCHDYGAGGSREIANQTTVGEQKAANIHVGGGASREDFVRMRSERDAGLGMPRLLFPAVQFNIRAGEAPPAEDNGTRYFKIPLDRF